MFLLLIKIRLLSAWNAAGEGFRRQPLIAVGLSLLGTAMFVGVLIGFLTFFHFAATMGVLDETVYQIFYFLFLFLLAGAVPFVASTLLQSADYALLFAAPLPPRAVVAAKLLDATVTNSMQFAILGTPAILACAFAVGIPAIYWLLIPVLIGLFVLLPALLTALGLLLALALLGMKRLRAAISLMNAIMAITVCITIVLEASHLPKPGAFAGTFAPMLALSASPSAHLSPSGWFASVLLAMAGGNGRSVAAAMAVILLVVGTLYALCVTLGGRLLSAASVAEGNDSSTIGGAAQDDSRHWRRFFAPPVAALIVKDFKYMSRDSVLLSQLTMPLILFLVPFLLPLQDSTLRFSEEVFPFAAMMIGIILFMQTSILSLSSIGIESQSFWIVLNSPNTGWRLLWAKFVMSTLFSAGTAAALTLISGFVFRIRPEMIAAQIVLVTVCAAALCGMGVGISAAFPRFVYENPAHRVSLWALVIGFFASAGYLLFTALIYGCGWFLTSSHAFEMSPKTLWGICFALHFTFSAYAAFLPLAIGAKRIERIEWGN